jgi:LSD1 subclass zinc finger protein
MAVDSVTCSGCSAQLKLPPEATPGRTVRCPKCGATMPVPEAAKEEVLDCDLLDRMKGLEGYRIRGQKKAPPPLVAELPEIKPSPRAEIAPRSTGLMVLLLILLLLVGGLALAGALATSLTGLRSSSTSSQSESPSSP